MKKILALMLALCVLTLPFSALAEAAESGAGDLPDMLEYRPITKMYVNYDDTLAADTADGVFMKSGDGSMLYMSVRQYYAELMDISPSTQVAITADEDSLSVSRPNGSAVTFLRDENLFYYSDMDLFRASAYAANGGDAVTTYPYQRDDDYEDIVGKDGQKLVNLISRSGDSESFSRSGDWIGASFDDYGIPVFWTEDDLYLPLCVFNNLFSAGSIVNMIFLNGTLYQMYGRYPDTEAEDEYELTMDDYYYSTDAGDRPQDLTTITYALLCLELDLNYGLKDAHGIGDEFNEFLDTVGLRDRMLELDGASFHDALTDLTNMYFADFHSQLKKAGPYTGEDHRYSSTSYPASEVISYYVEDLFSSAREDAGLTEDGTILQPYMEVGDTAFVTFDSFTYTLSDYYDPEVLDSLEDYIGEDTIALVIYAHRQITRENSPIRRVVVDLSNNGGGVVDSAVFLLSWMLGDCPISTTNPTTDAKYTVVYSADCDMDGKITYKDHLDTDEIKLYCLISGNSFSCGNLVPAVLKQSSKCVLLGQTSGGGACVVQNSLAADGTVFTYSGCRQLCTVKNGSYYSVDQGVEPHYTISDPAHFYDREWLAGYIAQLP